MRVGCGDGPQVRKVAAVEAGCAEARASLRGSARPPERLAGGAVDDGAVCQAEPLHAVVGAIGDEDGRALLVDLHAVRMVELAWLLARAADDSDRLLLVGSGARGARRATRWREHADAVVVGHEQPTAVHAHERRAAEAIDLWGPSRHHAAREMPNHRAPLDGRVHALMPDLAHARTAAEDLQRTLDGQNPEDRLLTPRMEQAH